VFMAAVGCAVADPERISYIRHKTGLIESA